MIGRKRSIAYLAVSLAVALSIGAGWGSQAQTVTAEGTSTAEVPTTGVFLPARFYLKEFIPKNLWDYISYSELMRADRAARSGKWLGLETLYSADDEFCRIVLDALQEDYSRLAVSMRKPGMVGGLNAGEWNPSCEQRRLDASLGYAGSSQHRGQCGTKFEPPPESVKWRWVGWERELPLPVEGGGVFAVSHNGLLHDIPVQSGPRSAQRGSRPTAGAAKRSKSLEARCAERKH